MAWIYKDIIFIHIWAVIVVQFLWPLQLSWTDSVMQGWGLAMFVGAARTCPLLVVNEFSSILHKSCSRSVKWCNMCVKTGQRTFPDSPRACNAKHNLCWNSFLPWSLYIQHCPFWSKQNWEQFYSVLKKNKIALDTHTHTHTKISFLDG